MDTAGLLNSAKEVLDDLICMKEEPEFAEEAIDVDPQTVAELDQLSQIARADLSCMSFFLSPRTCPHSADLAQMSKTKSRRLRP